MKACAATGQRFGKLTLVRHFTKSTKWQKKVSWFECHCDCGNNKEVSWANLRAGSTKSCGCGRGDFIRNRQPRMSARESVARRVFQSYTSGARVRDLSWRLTFEQFYDMIFRPCHYCTVEGFTRTTAIRKMTRDVVAHNGIDRVDNDRGYEIKNCVPCCKPCNEAKSNRPLSWFKNWVQQVATNLNKTIDSTEHRTL